jgi:Raf kinase inhibitor-like YbhB/YbcL family protein
MLIAPLIGMQTQVLSLMVLAATSGSALADNAAAKRQSLPKRAKQSLTVTSSAFHANEAIPPEYTCDGTQVPPPLSWSAPPKTTRSIAILVEDPDAPTGGFTHWLVTGLPPTTRSLPVGGTLPDGAVAGKNGKGDVGYSGPCPPTGRHHYHFHVYALETTIPAQASKDDLLAAIDGHILADGQLIGTYEKVTADKPTARN